MYAIGNHYSRFGLCKARAKKSLRGQPRSYTKRMLEDGVSEFTRANQILWRDYAYFRG